METQGLDAAGIALAVLFTSTLSGIVGMGGGMILMGILLHAAPLEWAMVLHGCTQLASNGSRAVLHRHAIRWAFLPPYLAGALAAYAGLSWLAWTPSAGLAYLALGSLPWVARLPGLAARLDVTGGPTAALCGVVVFGAQVVAGASGPALDAFFLTSRLDRFGVVATKAITQTASHALKIAFYAALLPAADTATAPSPWLPLALAAITPLGSWLGKRALTAFSDTGFLRTTRWVAGVIGVVWIARGLQLLAVG